MGLAVNAPIPGASGRRHHLDRLKVLLTALVVFHHAAITYGATGDWFYREPSTEDTVTSQLLTLFCAVNQSFFMGMFFLLSGYLTPSSLQRKGAARFLKERLIRLGIPLLVFGTVLGPMTVELANGASWHDLRWTLGTDTGTRFVMGPLWFCWALLIFSLVFVMAGRTCLRLDRPRLPAPETLLAIAVLVGLAAFAVRQVVPVGHTVAGLQLGYFVSYLVLFAVGCMAARYRLLEALSAAHIRPLLWVSLVALPVLPVLMFAFERMGLPEAGFAGGWNLAALSYALWEPLMSWGVIGGLLVWSRLRLSQTSRAWPFWTDNAYGAFVMHAPVLVLVSMAVASLDAHPLAKWLWVASLSTALSFLVSFFLRQLPAVKNVL
jgi:fucose 4-O-acetylase-like acetyltransferase